MRESILSVLEKNSRIDIRELAIILGCKEIDVANEIAYLNKLGRNQYRKSFSFNRSKSYTSKRYGLR